MGKQRLENLTMPKLVALCPGQGAQKAGMGKAWFDASPAAKTIFEEADAVLGNALGLPLSEICFNDPCGEINKTNISQPAIYTCSVASWHGLREQGLDGEMVAAAGLSLGEYTALILPVSFHSPMVCVLSQSVDNLCKQQPKQKKAQWSP
jgi:malonyl CoA-acyl carrier protein transacylase